LSGAVAFDKERANAESARHFIAGKDSPERGRNDTGYGKVPEKIGESTTELFGVFGMF
jgi:hypothetical protein